MTKRPVADRRYLELHNGKWRVTIAVPRKLQGQLGPKLKRSLKTDSLALANRLKWQALKELRAIIDHAGGHMGTGDLAREALEVAEFRARIQDEDDRERVEEAILMRADEIQGEPVGDCSDGEGPPSPVYDPERSRASGLYAAMARGQATPVGHHHAAFLAQSQTLARTQGDDLRALKFLQEWCVRERVMPVLEAITRREAIRFMDELPKVAGKLHPVTLNKYLGRLSRYWQ